MMYDEDGELYWDEAYLERLPAGHQALLANEPDHSPECKTVFARPGTHGYLADCDECMWEKQNSEEEGIPV